MPKTISRTLNITRVTFYTVEVHDSTPQFVPRPDAIFPGQLEKDKVKKLLQGRYGKDTILVITNIDAGQHRYSMGLEDFVLHATITDGAFDDEEDDTEFPDELPGTAPAPGDNDNKAAPVSDVEVPVLEAASAPASGAADSATASGVGNAGADVEEQPCDDELPDDPAW